MPLTAPQARDVYDEALVINGLDVSQWTPDYLRKMRDSGITAANCTVQATTGGIRQAMDMIADWYQLLAECPDVARQVHCAADIRRAKQEQKVGVILGFQYAEPIENNAGLVAVYHRLGLRIFQLAYMHGNLLGDGCLEPRDAGLTGFGREVVQELVRHRMVIDLSHVGHQSTMDAIDLSPLPVAFTHANARSLCDTPRNKRDEAIRFCAAKGGVIGAVALGLFVSKTEPDSFERYLDHVDYLVSLVGTSHVAIGTDFTEGRPAANYQARGGQLRWKELNPVWPLPYAVKGVAEFPRIAAGLAGRGYGAADIRQIMGGNWLRLFETVWGG